MTTMSYFDTAKARLNALMERGEATLLSIETSCDETAAAVVKNGRQVLSTAVYTQIPIHRKLAAWCRSWPAATMWTRWGSWWSRPYVTRA